MSDVKWVKLSLWADHISVTQSGHYDRWGLFIVTVRAALTILFYHQRFTPYVVKDSTGASYAKH